MFENKTEVVKRYTYVYSMLRAKWSGKKRKNEK